jgi:hypothetical protein
MEKDLEGFYMLEFKESLGVEGRSVLLLLDEVLHVSLRLMSFVISIQPGHQRKPTSQSIRAARR